MISEYEKIIYSLEALLDVAGHWLSTSYPKDLDKADWYNPGQIVYKVDTVIVPNIINSNFLSKELCSQLTYFVQLVGRFNQLIDNFDTFKYSENNLLLKSFDFFEEHLKNKNFIECNNTLNNIENVELINVAKYIKYSYKLKKMVHYDGIGTMNNFENSNFPQLNKCYHDIKCLLKLEKERERGLFKDEGRYVTGDVLFIIFPAIIVAYYIICFFDKLFLFFPCNNL